MRSIHHETLMVGTRMHSHPLAGKPGSTSQTEAAARFSRDLRLRRRRVAHLVITLDQNFHGLSMDGLINQHTNHIGSAKGLTTCEELVVQMHGNYGVALEQLC